MENIPMQTTLELAALTKRYPGVCALDHVSLTLPAGKIVGLLGPNGSGKTTMIKLIAGLLQPTEGMAMVGGKKVGPETKAMVSYLPDRLALPTWMTVENAIAFYQDFYADFDVVRARLMIERLGVPPERKLKALSKGNQEKLQLVLVMARRARLYLLDEPIGGVDPATRDYILDTIIGSFSPEATILISTHLIADVEKALDEFYFLRDGRIVMHDSADNVRETQGKTVDELFREVFRC